MLKVEGVEVHCSGLWRTTKVCIHRCCALTPAHRSLTLRSVTSVARSGEMDAQESLIVKLNSRETRGAIETTGSITDCIVCFFRLLCSMKWSSIRCDSRNTTGMLAGRIQTNWTSSVKSPAIKSHIFPNISFGKSVRESLCGEVKTRVS
jgi:hypothetical protein